MKASMLTDEKIAEIVAADIAMLQDDKFPNLRLENDGPDWSDKSFRENRISNLAWWVQNGPKAADTLEKA